MNKIKNLVALLTMLTTGGVTGQAWGMNNNEQKINVCFSLAPENASLHLFVLDKSLDEKTLENAGAVERIFNPDSCAYSFYTLSREKSAPQGTKWVDVSAITLNNGNYSCAQNGLEHIQEQDLKKEIITILEEHYFLDGLAKLFVTEETNPVVLVKIIEQDNAKNIFVLVKSSVTVGVKATTPTAEELKQFECQQISAKDSKGDKITNIYKFDGNAPKGYELIRVGSYNNKRVEYGNYPNEISGDKFITKVSKFVDNIETNIENYEKPTEKDIKEEEKETISYPQPTEQPNTNNIVVILKEQPTSPLATIVYSTLSSLCGLFWGTIQSYVDTIPAARNHRTKTKLTTLALTGVTTGLLMNKTIMDKRADRRWLFGTAVISELIASRCGKQVVDATCSAVKKYWTKKC